MTDHDTGYCLVHPDQKLKRYIGPEGDDVTYDCPICRASEFVLIPFGTIEKDHCPYHSGFRGILGGDDHWYCENCDPDHFNHINRHYNK